MIIFDNAAMLPIYVVKTVTQGRGAMQAMHVMHAAGRGAASKEPLKGLEGPGTQRGRGGGRGKTIYTASVGGHGPPGAYPAPPPAAYAGGLLGGAMAHSWAAAGHLFGGGGGGGGGGGAFGGGAAAGHGTQDDEDDADLQEALRRSVEER